MIMGSALSFFHDDSSEPLDSDSLEQEVVETRLILLNFLPRELVDIVLDEAEYWPRLNIGKQAQEVALYAQPREDSNSSSCCLITDPLLGPGEPSEIKRPRQIRKLIFTTTSHDQGWGGPSKEEMNQHGPYHGSWTWFEACIVRERPEIITPDWVTRARSSPVELQAQDLEDEVIVGPPPKRWYVHCNRTAHGDHAEHNVTWTVYDEDSVDDETIRGRTGKSREFLDLLQSGDRIALIARARFPQWANYVREAAVDVVYSV